MVVIKATDEHAEVTTVDWNRTILVAEPQAPMMELICDVLARHNLGVGRFTSAVAALDSILTNDMDVVVLDVESGCRSPFEVMRDVQILADEAHGPVVILWARSSLGSLWAELQGMCERVIPEPIDPGEVSGAVRDLIRASAEKQAV